MTVLKQVKLMKHYLPDEDSEQHQTGDGIYCACCPRAALDEDDDSLPVTIHHVRFRLRIARRRTFNHE